MFTADNPAVAVVRIVSRGPIKGVGRVVRAPHNCRPFESDPSASRSANWTRAWPKMTEIVKRTLILY